MQFDDLRGLHHLLNTPLALELPCLRRYAEKPRASLVSTSDVFNAYALIGNIAVVPIADVLVHNADWFGMTYGRIRASFNAALADPEAKAIALLVDSPGGEVAGCFDLAEEIYAARGGKPIVAILDECAYSAAYALASAAEQIIVPRTGGTGSIGVVAMHVDMTAMLSDAGIKVTIVQYGAQKTETSPMAPLSDDARARMQTDIDMLGEMFVEMVARNRGMSAEAVRKTEAGIFLGQSGVNAGLADFVASPQEAFADLRKKIS